MKPGHQGTVVPLWCNVTHRPHRNWDWLQVWTNRKQSWVGELWQFFVVCKSEDELFYRQLMFMNPMIILWIHSHSLAFHIICVFRRSPRAWESTHESRQVMITVYFLQPLCLSDQILLPDKQTEINQKLKSLVTFKLMFNLWIKHIQHVSPTKIKLTSMQEQLDWRLLKKTFSAVHVLAAPSSVGFIWVYVLFLQGRDSQK